MRKFLTRLFAKASILALVGSSVLFVAPVNAGAATSISDTLTREKISVTEVGHVLRFTSPAASWAIGQTVIVTYTGFSAIAGTPDVISSVGTVTAGTSGGNILTLTCSVAACDASTITVGSVTPFTMTNPGTAGSYPVFLSGSSSVTGSFAIPITNDDQITVTAGVNPFITFQVVASSTSCSPGTGGSGTDHTPSGDGGTVAFGNVTASSVVVSNLNSVYHICTFVSTNAVGGYIITVKSAYGALQSTGTPADYMPYAGPQSAGSVTFSAGTGSYGLCLSTTVAANMDATTPLGNTLTGTGNFAPGTCTAVTTDGQTGGALTTSTQQIGSAAGPVQEGSAEWLIKISTTANQIPHTDYTDTLTFIATGTF